MVVDIGVGGVGGKRRSVSRSMRYHHPYILMYLPYGGIIVVPTTSAVTTTASSSPTTTMTYYYFCFDGYYYIYCSY